jgi:hypothetical protein
VTDDKNAKSRTRSEKDEPVLSAWELVVLIEERVVVGKSGHSFVEGNSVFSLVGLGLAVIPCENELRHADNVTTLSGAVNQNWQWRCAYRGGATSPGRVAQLAGRRLVKTHQFNASSLTNK